jgi:hypothetical protein
MPIDSLVMNVGEVRPLKVAVCSRGTTGVEEALAAPDQVEVEKLRMQARPKCITESRDGSRMAADLINSHGKTFSSVR